MDPCVLTRKAGCACLRNSGSAVMSTAFQLGLRPTLQERVYIWYRKPGQKPVAWEVPSHVTDVSCLSNVMCLRP